MPLKKSNPDLILIIVTLSLLTVGLIMVYSASAIWATYKFDDSFYFAKRQLLFACVGVIAMFFIMNVDYWTWRTWAKILIIICFIMLLAVLVPGIGMARNGSRSWIGVGAFSVQPSEFMKLAMIAFLAKFLSERQKLITSFKKGMLPSLGLVFLAFGLIMLQPDLGTGTVMVGTCIVMIFISGAKISHFVGLGLIGVAGFIGLILSAPYRIKRITSFLDPWEDPLGSGFQMIQSFYAIGPGGCSDWDSGKAVKSFSIYRNRRLISFLPYFPRNLASSGALWSFYYLPLCFGGAFGLHLVPLIYMGAL